VRKKIPNWCVTNFAVSRNFFRTIHGFMRFFAGMGLATFQGMYTTDKLLEDYRRKIIEQAEKIRQLELMVKSLCDTIDLLERLSRSGVNGSKGGKQLRKFIESLVKEDK
jgi:hypothetical protein